jgi:F0F1-type ATP synthase assembly protein I
VRLIPRPTVNPDDTLGRGMDIALVVLLFLGLGYLVDRWLGTQPLFMIGLLLLSVVGQFISIRYRYEARMQQHEAERRALAEARRSGSADSSHGRAA